MKYTILLAGMLLVPLLTTAQSVLSKLENSDDIGTLSIDKGMLGLVAAMSGGSEDQETKDFLDLAKTIDQIKVYISEDGSASKLMASTAQKYIKSSKMERLMKVRESDSEVDFYILEGNDSDHVREMVMLVNGWDEGKTNTSERTVLITMKGDIDLTKIGSLVEKMNLPEELKKAEKKE